jgi:hypothetical protein
MSRGIADRCDCDVCGGYEVCYPFKRRHSVNGTLWVCAHCLRQALQDVDHTLAGGMFR